jgi:hypothetical protein
MNAESRTNQEALYWSAVSRCLVEFHDYDSEKAASRVDEYRREVSSKMKLAALVFHEEPFYLACDLSNENLPLEKYERDYNSMMEKLSH